MSPALRPAVLAAACALAAAGEAAPGLSLTGLLDLPISGASFFAANAEESSAAVYTIDRVDLERLPVLSLADLIAYDLPGMQLGAHGRTGRLIGTRGILIDSNAKTMVLWDGQNLNQRNHFGYHAGLVLPLLGDLDRVAAIHGPVSLVHGSGAMNGIIDLSPLTGRTRPGTWVRLSEGPVDRQETGEISLGWAGDAADAFLYAGLARAGGVDTGSELPQSRPGDHARALRRSGRVSGNVHADTGLGAWSAQVILQRAAIDTDNVPGDAAIIDEWWEQDQAAARLGWKLPLGPEAELELRAPCELSDYQATTYARQTRGAAEAHLAGEAVLRFATGPDNRIALGGIAGWRRFLAGKHLLTTDPDASFESMDGHWREWAGFAEDVRQLGAWTLSAGVRFDWVDSGVLCQHPSVGTSCIRPERMSALSPRLAAVWKVAPDWHLRASWQRGFRTPDVAYWQAISVYDEALTAAGLPTRPALEPETMDSIEVGSTAQLADGRASLAVNGYWNRYHHLMLFRSFTQADVDAGLLSQAEYDAMAAVSAGGRVGHQINASESFGSLGGEVVGHLAPEPWWEATASYGYSVPVGFHDSETAYNRLATSDGSEWARYATHQLKADATVHPVRPLDLTLGFLVESALHINPPTPATAGYYDQPKLVVNARVQWFGAHGWVLGVTAQNLFGQDMPLSGDSNQYTNGKTGEPPTRVYADLAWAF